MMTTLAYNIGLKNDNKFEFQQKYPLEKRQNAARKYIESDQCFIVCEAHRLFVKHDDNNVQFPVLSDSIQNILNVVERKMKPKLGDTLFLYCQNHILRNEEIIRDVYNKHKNQEDGILYIKFCTQEAFGCN